jgi:hypothetical protein
MAQGASGVWLRAVSRLGLVCRGTVYVLVGSLALRLALAAHERTAAPASAAGAVQEAAAPAWGRVSLVVLVAGLAAYALTQLLEAVFRPSRATGTMDRWRQRAVSSWGCLLYLVFCLSTARLLAGTPAKQTAASEQRQDTDVTAVLLRTGWGRALLVLVGVLAVAAGVEIGRRSVRLDFRERFTAERMPRALALVTRALGGGLAASRVRSLSCWSVCSCSRPRCCPARGRRRGWTRSSVRWPAPPAAPGCWPCSHPACSATAFTA